MESRATTLLTTFGFWITPSSTRLRNSPIKWGAKRATEKYANLAASGYKARVLEKHKVFSSSPRVIRKTAQLPSRNKSMVVSGWEVCRASQTPPLKGLFGTQHLRPFCPENCSVGPKSAEPCFPFLQLLRSPRKIPTLRGWSQLAAVSRAEVSRLLHEEPHSAWPALLPP